MVGCPLGILLPFLQVAVLASSGEASSGNRQQRSTQHGFLGSTSPTSTNGDSGDPCNIAAGDSMTDFNVVKAEMKKLTDCVGSIGITEAREARKEMTQASSEMITTYQDYIDDLNDKVGGINKAAMEDNRIMHEHILKPESHQSMFQLWYGKKPSLSRGYPRDFYHKRGMSNNKLVDGACQLHDGESKIYAKGTIRMFLEDADLAEVDKSCRTICDEFSDDTWGQERGAVFGDLAGVSRFTQDGQYETKDGTMKTEGRLCIDHDMVEHGKCKQPDEERACVGYSSFETGNQKKWCMLHFSKDPMVGVLPSVTRPGKGKDQVSSNKGKIKCMEVLSLIPEVANMQKLESQNPEKFHELGRKKLVEMVENEPGKLEEILQSMERGGDDGK